MIEAFATADPVGGLIGGILIGLASAMMLLGAGRIAGVSGVAAKALKLGGASMSPSSAWMFLLGLPLGALIIAVTRGIGPLQYASMPVLVAAGLLVGFGTRMGSGCTSGHGVCGVSRLSQRSLVATGSFIVAGIATVAIQKLASS